MIYNIILVIVLFISSFSMVFVIYDYEKNKAASSIPNSKFNKKQFSKEPITQKRNNKSVITWDVNENWAEIQGNSFSLAVYKILDSKEAAEISITEFPGDAGGLESNVNRWRRQLNLPNQSIEEIIKNTIYDVNSIGEFSIHKIVNSANSELAFLCMILLLPESTIFIKLQTSKNGIDNLEASFYEFCYSVRFNI